MKKAISCIALIFILTACNNSGEKSENTDIMDSADTKNYYIIDTSTMAPTEDPDMPDTSAVKKDKMDGTSLNFPDKRKKDSAAERK